MAQGFRKGGGEKPKRDCDATLSFGVRDPKIEQASFISPPLKLYSLKQHLSGFSLLHTKDPAGFNFENFSRNIRGIKYILLEGESFEVLFTRTSAFLTYHGLPGKLQLLEKIIGHEVSGRVSIAASKEGSTLTICRITGRELGLLLEAASAGAGGGPATDSILPDESAEYVAPAEFRVKLSRCRVLSCEDGFSMESFASRINVVSVFRDEEDAGYFVIGLRNEDLVYSMYVNVAMPPVNEQNPLVCRMKYGEDECQVFRMNVVG